MSALGAPIAYIAFVLSTYVVPWIGVHNHAEAFSLLFQLDCATVPL